MKGKGFLGVALAALGLAGLTACEEGPMVTPRYLDPQGSWHLLTYAAQKGPVLATVEGQAFDQDAAALSDLVHDELAAMLRGKVLDFTADPGRAGAPDYRVRIAFGVPENWDGTVLCEEPNTPAEQAPQPGKVTVAAVFCQKTETVSYATGWAKLDTPSDRRFGDLINGLSKSLFVERD